MVLHVEKTVEKWYYTSRGLQLVAVVVVELVRSISSSCSSSSSGSIISNSVEYK